jgi:hypothetical protein
MADTGLPIPVGYPVPTGVVNVGGKAGTSVVSAAAGLDAVDKFFASLLSRETLVRLAEGTLGLILIAVGLTTLLRKPLQTAAKVTR